MRYKPCLRINDHIRIYGVRSRRRDVARQFAVYDDILPTELHRRFSSWLPRRSLTLHLDGHVLPANRPLPVNFVTRRGLLKKKLSSQVQAQEQQDHSEQFDAPETERGHTQNSTQTEWSGSDALPDLSTPRHFFLDKLFNAIKKHNPHAVPIARLQLPETTVDDDDRSHAEESYTITLSNRDYGVHCAHSFVGSEQNQSSVNKIFHDLIQQYIEQVKKCAELHKDKEYVNRATINRVRIALNLAPLTSQTSTINLTFGTSGGPQLFQTQMYCGSDPLGEAQTWPVAAIAERFASASADLEILNRAEQQGLIVDSLNFPSSPVAKIKQHVASPSSVEQIVEPLVYDAPLSEDCITAMIQTLREVRSKGLPDEVELSPLRSRSVSASESGHPGVRRDETALQVKQRFMESRAAPALRKIQAKRNKLPIRNKETSSKIRRLARENDVLILVSETGSGKTTQLPQLLLEEQILSMNGPSCRIVCTQPRRIAATSVAVRVAEECGTHLRGSVGYKVRFDSKMPTQLANITYMTAGALLRIMQVDPEQFLDTTSHVLVDEVHERSLVTDLLMALLRDRMRNRLAKGKKMPKIILMSATMDCLKFEQYFAEPLNGHCARVASIEIPGRAFPITTNSLDDFVPEFKKIYPNEKRMNELLQQSEQYFKSENDFKTRQQASFVGSGEAENSLATTVASGQESNTATPDESIETGWIPHSLIAVTIAHAIKTSRQGDVLVFLPGMNDLNSVAHRLLESPLLNLDFSESSKFRIFKLHSSLHRTNPDVFSPVPEGCRRIVLATEIAQTSITLPNVLHVIDSGKRRELWYDPITRSNKFHTKWIDKAASMQRRGRAGRVQAGYYWAMFTEARFQSMSESLKPEILTCDLTGPSLVVKSYANDDDLVDFFNRTCTPPEPASVAACIKELQEMGMLTAEQEITPLGQFCSEFPMHPAHARALLLGVLFRCLRPIMIVASHDTSSPLINPSTRQVEALFAGLQFAGVVEDDRYAFVQAFQDYERAVETQSTAEMKLLESKHIQPEAYRDMLAVGRQIYELMAEYWLLRSSALETTTRWSNKPSMFSRLPDKYNENSESLALFKAITLTGIDTNLAVWNERGRVWMAKDIRTMVRPYSVNAKAGLSLLERAEQRVHGEIVGFTEMIQIMSTYARPTLVETSTVTPLMAMLFGGPIAMVGKNTIEIDGWLRYELRMATSTTSPNGPTVQVPSLAMLVLEFRKAIDRFLVLAFSNLRNVSRLPRGERRLIKRKQMFNSNPVRRAMVTGLKQVLELDDQYWDKLMNMSRSTRKSQAREEVNFPGKDSVSGEEK